MACHGGHERRSVPLIDVRASNSELLDELREVVLDVLASGRYLFGPAVSRFEDAIAQLCGVQHAVACASGSDALLLSLMAIGVGPGDEVIVPTFTFFATASAAWRLGAKPVFVDIDPDSFTLDVDHVADLITSRTRAIIPVHLFGRCAQMDSLMRIVEERRIAVIEDAAQSIKATCCGRAAGSWGTFGCFSFYPTKNLGGCGDGGLITTHDPELADKLRVLANHGMSPRYIHRYVGINSRLDTLQAAILLKKLPFLDTWIEARRRHAAYYTERFVECGLDGWLIPPTDDPYGLHVWNQYTIRVPAGDRDALRQWLAERGIGTEVYYPVPLHLQPCFETLGYQKGQLPVAERVAAEVLSLPVYPELSEVEQDYVIEQIRQFAVNERREAA